MSTRPATREEIPEAIPAPRRRLTVPRRLARTARSGLVAALCLGLTTGCATQALTVQEEKQIGTAEQSRVRRSVVLVRDRVIVTYIQRLGEELARAAPVSPYSLRFYVVDDPSLNAFAIPGGSIYIHTGILLNADNVAELAGVMAHEIGHVTQRHIAKRVDKARQSGFFARLLALAVAIGSGGRYNAALPAQLLQTAYLGQFSRADETESDTVAVETLARAGYDPMGLVTFFEKLEAERNKGDALFAIIASHPAPATRIDDAKARIAQLESPGEARTDDGKFSAIRARVKLFLGDKDDLGDEGDDLDDDELDDTTTDDE